jgi:hypothetical protein
LASVVNQELSDVREKIKKYENRPKDVARYRAEENNVLRIIALLEDIKSLHGE